MARCIILLIEKGNETGADHMGKWKKTGNIIIAAVLSVCMCFSLSGCAKRTIVVPVTGPDLSIKDNIKIDWQQVRDDCENNLNDKSAYPHGSYIDCAVDETNKKITLIWVMTNDANQLESLDYAKTYIKTFNDVAKDQDFSITASTDDSYGGLWDRYSMDLELYREKDILTWQNYFVYQTMDAGSNDPVLPLTKSDVESIEAANAADEATAESGTAEAGNSAADTTAGGTSTGTAAGTKTSGTTSADTTASGTKQ